MYGYGGCLCSLGKHFLQGTMDFRKGSSHDVHIILRGDDVPHVLNSSPLSNFLLRNLEKNAKRNNNHYGLLTVSQVFTYVTCLASGVIQVLLISRLLRR